MTTVTLDLSQVTAKKKKKQAILKFTINQREFFSLGDQNLQNQQTQGHNGTVSPIPVVYIP